MSITPAARPAVAPVRRSASVLGADAIGCQRAGALLAAAGFAVTGAEATTTSLAVLLTGDSDALRARQVRDALEARPGRPLLAIVAAGVSNAALRRVLVSGASGIVFDADVEHALAASASALLAGQLVVPGAMAQQIAPRPLSYREKQVMSLVLLGLTNREIADRLYLAESTVKTHLSSSFRKLDARSRADAVARIQDPEHGLGAGILELAANGAP